MNAPSSERRLLSPSVYAGRAPHRPAQIDADTGETVTYLELEERSAGWANWLRARGLGIETHIAVMLENHVEFLTVAWAAQRAGLIYTTISTHLREEEILYLLNDSGAEAVIASEAMLPVLDRVRRSASGIATWALVDGTAPGFTSYHPDVAACPSLPPPDQCEGADMLYSSGTTGRPKGIRISGVGREFGRNTALAKMLERLYDFGEDSVYLAMAPLYHAGPLRFAMAVQRLGGTVVVMHRFDARRALESIERFGVTHGQFVPTMFVRMLRLPADERESFDTRSLTHVIHSAAPCPVEVKEQMLEWLGPIIYEYYAATEGHGFTAISPAEWVAHKGSVGRAQLGEIHILDDEGEELPPGEVGAVWFEGGGAFRYHNDDVKTAGAQRAGNWSAVGDVGYVDAEGYLYLTGRESSLIISGGVNIYPAEVANVLLEHPAVADVAVFGVPDEDFGEAVKAVVELCDADRAGSDTEAVLIAYCRERLASYKCPKSIQFDQDLPRLPTGKVRLDTLRERYGPPGPVSGHD